MGLTLGVSLGPHEISAQIDVGGMGSVCRAMTNLGCDVL